jgi:pimeloyl-ACP methyl ester carboxylesterase
MIPVRLALGSTRSWSARGREDVVVDAEVDVRYATSRDARLAFTIRAGGPHVIVWVPPWVSNQDLENLDPQLSSSWLERLSSFATVVSYDQRGTGLSDPVSLGDLPTLEGWADDLHAVVTAAAPERVVVLADAMGGPMALLYAATHPERIRALILHNTFAVSSRSPDEHDELVAWIENVWGSGRFLREIMPDVPVDAARLRDLARIERQSMSPAVAGAIFRWIRSTDVRAVLPAISAPTLVLHTASDRKRDRLPAAGGRWLPDPQHRTLRCEIGSYAHPATQRPVLGPLGP